MIPATDFNDPLLEGGIEETYYPSKTYRMIIDQERIIGTVDEVEALKQMIYKQINTEPVYQIYANFGVKKRDLYGEPKPYAFMKISGRIKEALEMDDRVLKVRNFVYMEEWSKGDNLGFTFIVDSVFGEIKGEEVIDFASIGN